MRAGRVPSAEDRTTVGQELALLRRGVLAFDILICGGLGYWIGDRDRRELMARDAAAWKGWHA